MHPHAPFAPSLIWCVCVCVIGHADLAGSMCSILRELCLRCAWSLSAAHPVVCARLVSLGCAHLAAHTATSMRAGSSLVCVAANYIMHLTPHAEHVAELGGLVQVREGAWVNGRGITCFGRGHSMGS